MRNPKKGFTLVEVLIVVVIIAILAALIVPRMLAQTEKAKAAEALQMIGAIKRAAERHYDFTKSYNVSTAFITSAPGSAGSGNWSDLGLQGLEQTKNFSYDYSPNGNSFIIRIATCNGATCTFPPQLTYTADEAAGTSSWNCRDPLKPIEPASPGNTTSLKGCTI